MALVDGQFAILFADQTLPGVFQPSLQTLVLAQTASLDSTDGLVLGDAGSGVGESGIDYTFDRIDRDAGKASSSLTQRFGGLEDVEVTTFTFSWPIAGNRATLIATPVDGEFQYLFGREALFLGCGLAGAGSGTPGWSYIPTAASAMSALILDSGYAYAIKDCLGSLSMSFTPGSVGIYTATITGKLDRDESGLYSFPTTLDYGPSASVAAPSVELSANIFGQTRGFSELSIDVDNSIETTPDSNQEGGARIEQSDRVITLTGVIDIDSTDVSFDYDNLVAATAQTDDFVFNPSADAANAGISPVSNPALYYKVTAANLSMQTFAPAKPARSKATSFTAIATGETADSEFIFELL